MGSVSILAGPKVKRGAKSAPTPPANAQRAFEPELLESTGFSAKLIDRFMRNPFWLMAFLRNYWPMPVIKGWGAITRYDDVAEAMQNDKAVAVPFAEKIKLLNDGPNFVLGMKDGPEYQWHHEALVAAFPLSDNAEFVAPIAREEAEHLVQNGDGEIDAIRDLITLVPTRICERYYGVNVPEEFEFGQWTIAMSSFMFGDPGNNPVLREVALAASDRLRPLLDTAIANAKAGPDAPTVVSRLVKMQPDHPEMNDAVIRGMLMGTITGFVPTNTMAAGHILEKLLEKPDWMAQARMAALADDDDLLKRCLFEALRFYPINPGPFRECAEDVTIAAGTKREKTIKKGTNLMVMTQSAMFDPRRVPNPKKFDPTRKDADYMSMGFGLHWCIGAPLAFTQITQTLKPLLTRKNLRRAPGRDGRLEKLGPFPSNLVVLYDN